MHCRSLYSWVVKLVLRDFPEGNGRGVVCGIAHIAFLKHYLFIWHQCRFSNATAVLSYYLIRTLFRSSNKGISTNLMKPIWAVGLLTLSRSIKGATGRPSDFSRSLCNFSAILRQLRQHGNLNKCYQRGQNLYSHMNYWWRKRMIKATLPGQYNHLILHKHLTKNQKKFLSFVQTCIKYSSRRQSAQGSETSMGRTSFEMSQHLIRIFLSWKVDLNLKLWRVSFRLCHKNTSKFGAPW